VLNAANEVAVAAFLQGHLAFMAIPAVVEAAIEREAARTHALTSLDDALAADRRGRALAENFVAKFPPASGGSP
jgi:1-deoxy-D-xylulose-5-phosphate reductoisomerase